MKQTGKEQGRILPSAPAAPTRAANRQFPNSASRRKSASPSMFNGSASAYWSYACSQISPDPTRETAFAAFSCGSSNVNVLGMEDYYETDGEGARQDFAIRSGLVQGCRVFSSPSQKSPAPSTVSCIGLFPAFSAFSKSCPSLSSSGRFSSSLKKWFRSFRS